MTPRRISIEKTGTEDRETPGTKAQRREQLPLGVRIRYGIAIVVSFVAAYGAWKAENTSASQAQLQRVQADSCHVFQFVDQRFLTPTRTETAAQKQITTQFAGQLHQAVADCARAGYR